MFDNYRTLTILQVFFSLDDHCTVPYHTMQNRKIELDCELYTVSQQHQFLTHAKPLLLTTMAYHQLPSMTVFSCCISFAFSICNMELKATKGTSRIKALMLFLGLISFLYCNSYHVNQLL